MMGFCPFFVSFIEIAEFVDIFHHSSNEDCVSFVANDMLPFEFIES